jgi:hypothetical protein
MAIAYALLHEAVRVAPDYSLARWQLGQIKVGSEWLSLEEAERRAAADPRQANYRERKALVGETPQGQLELARWCRGNNLNEEARFHWASVLAVDANNREALRATGMRWRNGKLATAAQFKEQRKQMNDTTQDSRRWASRVAVWLRALSDRNGSPPAAILAEIAAVTDVAAIPAIENVTLRNELLPNGKNPGRKRLTMAFLTALKEMRGQSATDSLMRYAVMSPFNEARAEATGSLRYRPLHDVVPTLLENLEAPVQSSYRKVTDWDGSVHYLHSIYCEGPFADRAYRSERSIYQPRAMPSILANLIPSEIRPALATVSTGSRSGRVTEAGAAVAARRYEQEIMAGERWVSQVNQKSAALNERIIAVFSAVTDQDYGNQPRKWWDWWQDYTDYYRDGERPVYGWQETSNEYVMPPLPQPSSVECFAAGTPVWTKTGQRPIESLQIGDLVLAQNVDTGEIRYQPVLARTLRPAGPIVQISTGGEQLLATRGHPLWVDGVGWRMARELDDGAMLHSVGGGNRIDAIRRAKDAETYNLVVADFNTYFVGKGGVLAHDNTPRRPTPAILPGISQK